MATTTSERLEGAALDAWRSYLQSHASILRVLDAELAAEHGMTTRDYEVLLSPAPTPARATVRSSSRRAAVSGSADATLRTAHGRRGGVVTQRPAKPSTPVRFRSSPLLLPA